jgi:predicted integral membrane protein DUF2269
VSLPSRVAPSRGRRLVRWRLPRPALLALVTVHIATSVGLLGDSAGFLAVAVRRAVSDDVAFRQAARDLLAMFALYFGIPLSLLALLTGTALALLTKWGLFHHPWVMTKLALIVSVIVVGATLISPVIQAGAEPNDIALVVGGSWDVLALLVATALAVVKPWRQKAGRRKGGSRS